MATQWPKSPVTVLGAPQLNTALDDGTASHGTLGNRQATVETNADKLLSAAVPNAISAAFAHGVDVTFLGGQRTGADFLRDMVIEQSRLSSPVILAVDLGTLSRQLSKFHSELPGARVHYAIKSLPDNMVIALLARLGASFDCASAAELNMVHAELSSIGRGDPDYIKDHIIFANPVKNVCDLQLATRLGVTYMTADSSEEVRKISRHVPDGQVIIRISTNDSTAQVPLSAKFGAQPAEVDDILRAAVECGVTVAGVAFHVGSGARHAQPYQQALKTTRNVFDLAQTYDMTLDIVDIGGGFPGTDCDADVTFKEIGQVVKDTLVELFPRSVRVFAEPGRFIAKACITLAARVLRTAWRGSRAECTIGDGVYGAFRDAHALGERYPASLLWSARSACESTDARSTLYDLLGPTMQAEDVIERDVMLPSVAAGDWLVFHNMGAYTHCLRSLRKDVPKPTLKYVFTSNS